MSNLLAHMMSFHWPVLLIGLAIVGTGWRIRPIYQGNNVLVKGGNTGDISQINTTISTPDRSSSRGSGLSFLADVLQVIGFAILMLQLAGVLKT